MIRWSYLIPRLVLLAAVLLVVGLGLDPLLRWSLVSLAQRAWGAKVEVGELKTRLATTEISFRDVQVANPRQTGKNLFEAAEITLRMETNPLLRRKFVVREGRISGLRFDTPRATPGTVERESWLGDLLPDDLADRIDPAKLAQLGQAWLDRFALVLKREITEEVEQFESVRLARELAERWPAEFARLEAKAEELKVRGERLRAVFQGSSRDWLRDLGSAQQVVADVDALERQIAEFRTEVERLRDQAIRDQQAIVAARDQDVRHVRERLHLDDLESGGLSEYLLGHELNQRVQTAARWVCWARQHWPSESSEPAPTRARGVDVVFAGLAPQPDFLIRHATVEAEGRFRGEPLTLVGTMEGVTAQPAAYGQPAVLRLQVQGPLAMEIQAVLDRTQAVARDYLTVEVPRMAQPKRLLGRPGELALLVSPGDTRLSLRLEMVGEGLSGRLSMRQEPVEVVPELSGEFGGRELAGRLREAVGTIRQIDATAEISGTLQRPEWKMHSNLGPQLAQAFQGLLQRELEIRREELSQLVKSRVEEETARFEQTFLARQQALLAKAQQSGLDVQQLRDLVARRVPGLDRVLDKKLPISVPLRF